MKKKILYLAVTNDALELPLVVTDDLKVLSAIFGISPANIYSYAFKESKGRIHKVRFRKIEVDLLDYEMEVAEEVRRISMETSLDVQAALKKATRLFSEKNAPKKSAN